MPKEDDRVRRVLEHPATQTLLGVAAVALSFIGMARTFSTRGGRSWYAKAYREGAVAQRERELWHERNHQRYAARSAYFEGRGSELLTERGLVVAGPGKPFPDASFERLTGGFRRSRFRVRSREAQAELLVDVDSADRDGGIALNFDDGRRWALSIEAKDDDLRQYDMGRPEPLPDVEMARFAARLLAVKGCGFRTITLMRPDFREIREQIWRDHVAKHPELAEEEWPF